MEFIKSFSEIGKEDNEIAGGKGASLGEMSQAGVPVPSGFVLLASAFERFAKETDLNVEIDAILKTVNPEAVHTTERASEKIQALILDEKMPEDIGEELQEAFLKLGAEYVAVRSSATSEDSADAAWAGQLDSFLNTTKENLLENVQRCWASLFTPRAIFYRFEKKLEKQFISVAVVVQEMVNSEKSGIAFSVHPVSEDRNQMIIEAGLGLGEAIVSGSITPDAYVLEKEPRKIIDINVNEQKKALYRKKGGGNEWEESKEQDAKAQVLDEEEIKELGELVVKIENHYGFPCDIEWAFEKGKFYIVQSRPITTLNMMEGMRIFKKHFNRVMGVIACQYWDAGERIALKKFSGGKIFFNPLFIFNPDKGVAVYYDWSDEMQDPKDFANFLHRNPKEFEKIIAKTLESREEVNNILKTRDFSWEELGELMRAIQNFWPFLDVINIVADFKEDEVNQKLVERALELRVENEKLVYDGGTKLFDEARAKLGKQAQEFAHLLTLEEMKNGKGLENKIAQRKGGYLFFEGRVYPISKEEEFLQKEKIKLDKALKGKEIKGSVAFPGKVKGRAKIAFSGEEALEISEGEILVAPMTTPSFLPAMKKAAAFITDEGGITCHAAIVAREFKKPCIIGTGNATEILKNGMEVELDGESGEVRILR